MRRLLTAASSEVRKYMPRVLGLAILIYVAGTMLVRYDRDTSNVSAAAFVVVAVVAGLAFTYAGVLASDDSDRDEVIYAGESLTQGAMLFLGASLLKHGAVVIPPQLDSVFAVLNVSREEPNPIAMIVLILQIVLFFLLLSGLIVAFRGYDILGRVIMRRMDRRRAGLAVDHRAPDPDAKGAADT